MLKIESLFNKIREINLCFGRGDVRDVCFDSLGPAVYSGYVIRQVPVTQHLFHDEYRRFKLVRGKLSFLGKKRVVK